MTRASCPTNTEETVTTGCKMFSNHLMSKQAYAEEQHLPRLPRYTQISNIQEYLHPYSAINSYKRHIFMFYKGKRKMSSKPV